MQDLDGGQECMLDMDYLLNLICVADMSVKGIGNMNMCTIKKHLEVRVKKLKMQMGCDRWMDGFNG